MANANANANERRRQSLLVFALVGALWGCSSGREPSQGGGGTVSPTRAALSTSNGLAENGLSTNGLIENGFWSNGFWSNGFWSNGFWSNGFWSNGFWSNGFWSNGLTGNAAVPGDTLRNSVYARELLEYIYSCAMPPTTYDATLDPNDGTLLCDGSSSCDAGYTCSAQGTCVIPLAGSVGVGVNADGTTWGDSGTCDESCQRWVSACVLARTNAYGVHVKISMRAPAVVPPGREAQFAKIQAALATSAPEVATYDFREGAYYGNIFETTPATPPPASGSGPATGAIASTPQYYACAGPDSNTPEITKRFCSSQGDQSVINVPGLCVPSDEEPEEPSVCDGVDATGSIYGCSTIPGGTTGTHYDEVITVYLNQPLAVCGNSVCEAPGEDATSCPSDCHPHGWAQSVANVRAGSATPKAYDYHGTSAVSPVDDTVVVGTTFTGGSFGPFDPSFGGAPVTGDPGESMVAKYKPDGEYVWGTRFFMPCARNEVVVAGDGSIFVAGFLPATGGLVNLAKLNPEGDVVTMPIVLGGTSAQGSSSGHLAIDAAGNLYITGVFQGTATFSTAPSPTTFASPASDSDLFVVKVTPDGTPLWATHLGGPGFDGPNSISISPSGEVILTADLGESTTVTASTALYELDPGNGVATLLKSSPTWNPFLTATVPPPVYYTTALSDGSGELYVTGNFSGTYDFGAGCGPSTASTAREFFLARYSPDGAQCRWVARGSIQCPPNAIYCGAGLFEGGALAFDSRGDVVVGGRLDALFGATAPNGTLMNGPGSGAIVDFGAGDFQTYRYSNPFVASYDTSGSFLWAKQMPIVLLGNLRGLSLDSQDNVVVSGTYTGSMQVDGRLLVDVVPESTDIAASNTYVASFAAPSLLDATPPSIGVGSDLTGVAIETVPSNIYVQATSAAGANVFFMPPTAVDASDAGVSVACAPAPNTTFPLGTTTVSCTATDAVGNKASASFTVTVVDTFGPIFSPVSDLAPLQATSVNGAVVTYALPTATDQVDGARPVTCSPASGTVFATGKTTVTCTAADKSKNQTQVTFQATVTPPPFGTACSATAPCAVGACVDGVCCNTTATSCGQCQACDVPGSLGTCAPVSGSSCDDGNACTRVDTCQAGVCVGSNPVTCAASDQCHVAGVCVPTTGACSNPSAPNGTSCNDGNACTTADTCSAGACVGGAPRSCDDGNPCTVDSCAPATGCVSTAGNAGAVCRAAGNACDTAETCTGKSATCPADVDKLAPKLAAGTNQTVVGSCTSAAVPFTIPTPTGSCETAATVSCTWTQNGSHPSPCGASGVHTGSLPGNSYGAHTVTCTAKDAAGNVSTSVSFSVTVLQPLTVKVQPPLSGDNDAVDNVVKAGSTVPTKVQLFACGANVTTKASIIAKLAVSRMTGGGATNTSSVTATTTGAGETNGVMTLDGASYRYNLSTKGFSVTAGVPAFYQETISVAYQSAPNVIVGTDLIQIDTK